MFSLAGVATFVGIIGSLLAVASQIPGSAGFLASWSNNLRQERALARIRRLDDVHVGAVIEFWSPDVGGGSSQLGNIWTIMEMSKKGIIMSSKDYQKVREVQKTCVEFEAGTAIVIKDNE